MADSNSSGSGAASALGDFDRDEIAYLAPMMCFLAIIWIGTQSPEMYPWAYVARTICAAGLLFYFRKRYTPISWDYWWLGIVMGVLGVVQWIGMDTLLQHSHKFFQLDKEAAFNPAGYFSNRLALWGWITIRLVGSSMVVPVMEELFWRDYLWRKIIAPADFKLAKVGEWDRIAFWVVALAFCVVHPQWLTAIGWGLMVGGLLAYTRSLGACIIMHGVTNFLLGLYVLKTQQWWWW